jgi:poly(A) polymerase
VLVRYSILHGPDGREYTRKGLVYTLEEHGIDRSRVDPDAIRVIKRLRQGGFQGYVVGGAVRDLLVGIQPKDYDIATNAHPNQVRKLFRTARVIGRRFRLVHVYSRRDKYLEVATFRADGDADGESPYGSMAEDAWRRDFTLNALYYCPIKQQIIDYVGGVKDIRAKRMRTIAPEHDSFTEDPVRIIRAVKHAEIVGFRLPFGMRRSIRRLGGGLSGCSPQRVTEELYKILRCGRSRAVLRQAHKLGVLRAILPALHASLAGSRARERRLWERLDEVDGMTARGGAAEIATGRLLAALLPDAVPPASGRTLREVAESLRAAAAPLIPSNNDLRVAASLLLRKPTARP